MILFESPNINLIYADCMGVMQGYPDNYFDWAVCDIPYGIGVGNMAYLKEMGTTVKQKNGTKLNGNKNKIPYTFKNWDKIPPPQSYFDELKRVCKEQIIFGVEYVDWDGLGEGRIRWNKGVADGMSFKKYELAYCSAIDYVYKLDLLWVGMCQAASLYEPMIQQGNKKLNEKRIHPCHKPVLLYKKIFLDFLKQEDKVLDTHGGSMSSVIAGIDFEIAEMVCIEIDKEYFDMSIQRIKTYLKRPKGFFKEKEINKGLKTSKK